MPGAASLLCERDGRRIVYAGPIGAAPAEVRAADALCIDATFASPALAFPRARAGAGGGRARRARRARPRGGAPVVLVDPVAIALDVGAALAADRIGLCAHRDDRAGGDRPTGAPGCRRRRCSGSRAKIGPGEALLWPASVRVPPRRAGARAPGVILVVGGRRIARRPRRRATATARVVFPTAADFAGLAALRRGDRRLRGRAGQRPRRRAGGHAARARNRRLHAGTAAADRAFRRLSLTAG